MRKIFTSIGLVLVTGFAATAQTTAPDFTATDCSGVTHHLHDELDNGKIIVISWVMPCHACVGASKSAYDAVHSFNASHPGKVVFYMVDDFGDDGCSDLSAWATSEGIGNVSNISFFANASDSISMNGYGGPGMPKVVVLAGTDHKIYFHENDGSADDITGLTNAIDSALITTGIAGMPNEIQFSMTPNPATDRIMVGYSKPVTKVVITTVNGQVVAEESFATGTMNPVISTSAVASGIYLVKLTDIDGKTGIQRLVKQ